MYSEEQFRKLPQWAQQAIKNAERDRDDYARMLQEQRDATEVTRISYGDVYHNPRYLPEGAYDTVRFTLPDEHNRAWVDIKMARDFTGIEISASESLTIRPRASNVAHVSIGRYEDERS